MGGNVYFSIVTMVTFALISFLVLGLVVSTKEKDANNPEEKWKMKDPRDYTDADLERLLEQWEV